MKNCKHYCASELIQGMLQDVQKCRIMAVALLCHVLFLLCCVFALSVHSYFTPSLLILFLTIPWQTFPLSNVTSGTTSSVSSYLAYLEDLEICFSKF